MPARNHIAVVEKALAVFEALARFNGSAELKDLAEKTGIGKSTVFRILHTLKELGYVEQVSHGQVYTTTAKVFGLARSPARRPRLTNIVHPYLVRLRNELQESAWFAEWCNGVAVLVDVVESRQPLRLSYDLGDRCPLHASALGKAIAAYLNDEDLMTVLPDETLPQFTPYTTEKRDDLVRELVLVRKRGYASNRQETVEGAVVFAAPLLLPSNRVVGAISVTSPLVRCPTAQRQKIIQHVKGAAHAASELLAQIDYRPPNTSFNPPQTDKDSMKVTP